MADLPLFPFTSQEDWYGELVFTASDDGAALSLAGRRFEMPITAAVQGVGGALTPARTLDMNTGGGLSLKAGAPNTLIFRVPRDVARGFDRGEYTADVLEVVDGERHLFMPVRVQYSDPSGIRSFLSRFVGVSVSFASRVQPIVSPVALTGRQGAPGATIVTGAAPPVPADGKDGDYWIEDRTAASRGRRMYGPKVGGAWPGTPWTIQVAGIPDVPGLGDALAPKLDPTDAVERAIPLPQRLAEGTLKLSRFLRQDGSDETATVAHAVGLAVGKVLELPTGPVTTRGLNLPAGLLGITGPGSNLCQLVPPKVATAAGTSILQFDTGGKKLEAVGGFSADLSSDVFRLVHLMRFANVKGGVVEDIEVVGRVNCGILVDACDDLTINGFRANLALGDNAETGIYARLGSNRITVRGFRGRGGLKSGVNITDGDSHLIDDLYSEGSAGINLGFPACFDGVSNSLMRNIRTRNSGDEGFNLTHCTRSGVDGFTLRWDDGVGDDMGFSITGENRKSEHCFARNGRVENSIDAGIGVCNNARFTTIQNVILRNCGVRAAALYPQRGPAAASSVLVYNDRLPTALPAPDNAQAVTFGNTFAGLDIRNDTGSVRYVICESHGVANSVIGDNRYEVTARSVATEKRYNLAPGSGSKVVDATKSQFTSTPVAANGNLGPDAVCNFEYMLKGDEVVIFGTVSIPKNGTGAGAIDIPLPVPAAYLGGTGIGQNVADGQFFGLVASQQSLRLLTMTNGYPAADGFTGTFSMSYRPAA